jgi:hypothetical protein
MQLLLGMSFFVEKQIKLLGKTLLLRSRAECFDIVERVELNNRSVLLPF